MLEVAVAEVVVIANKMAAAEGRDVTNIVTSKKSDSR
jgi:hypothetical protein